MTHPRKITDEPRVFMTDDARHAAPTYQMQPPLEPADLFATIDQLAGSGFDTISWSAGVEGGSMMYPSKVLPMWGESVTSWTHSV